MRRIIAGVLLLLAFVAPAVHAAEPPMATIDTGQLQGAVTGGMVTFKGIPYAAPPVGALRWRPPQPPAAWEGVRTATGFAAACPQPAVQGQSAEDAADASEDCLYLNVFAPETPAENLPVMVWIHGGEELIGASQDAIYTPTNLVKNGVIVVTLDYRLGNLGYFAPQPLIDEAKTNKEPVGNYGEMDKIAALQWVQRNIAAFGGDPDNVTIFGESGGGRSITWLMISPPARGLFHRAIAESARVSPLAELTTSAHGQPAQAEIDGKFMTRVGASTMEELRALRADTVIANQAGDFDGGFIDGQVIPGDPVTLFAAGKQAPVPFMIGTNSWDGSLFTLGPGPATLADYATSIGMDPATLAPLYADVPECLQASFAEADGWFTGGVKLLSGSMKGVAPGYAYYFDFMTGKLRDIYPGVPHGWEIPYVFGSVAQANPVDTYYLKGIDICETVQTGAAQMAANVYPTAQFPTTDATSSEDLAFSEQIAAMWTNFARTGNPNGEGDAWPVYDPAQDVMMQFAAESGPVTDLNKARVDPQIEMMKAVFGIE